VSLDQLSERVLQNTGNTENKDETKSGKSDILTERSEDKDICDTSEEIDEVNRETKESGDGPESNSALSVIMKEASEFLFEAIKLFV